MTLFHPPSLIEAALVLDGAAPAPMILAGVASALGSSGGELMRSWRWSLDGEVLPWPPDATQLAQLEGIGEAPSIFLDGPGGGIDLHRFDDGAFFPRLMSPPPLPAWRLTWTSPDLSLDTDPARLRAVRDAAIGLARNLAASRSLALHFASVVRTASCFAPAPPQAPPGALLMLCNQQQLDAQYMNPAAYWSAWDATSALADGRCLVTRGLDVDDETAFKRAIYPRTWDLARAAHPGQTSYPQPEVAPWERALIEEEEPTLTVLGYHDQLRCLEYTAYVGQGRHILPREIFALRALLAAGSLEDGSALERIRVSFPDRAMASREIVPLSDAGVEVLYLGASGEWETATAGRPS